jgi:hypothetical protein
MSIDEDASIHDEFICATAACDARFGDNFIQAHFGHVAIHSRQSAPPKDAEGG